MIKNYKEVLLVNAIDKIGAVNLFDKNMPVKIKCDFIVSENIMLMNGTLGYIERVNDYDVKYKQDGLTCDLTFVDLTDPNGWIVFPCQMFNKTNDIQIIGLKNTISLKDLIEIPDEETSRKIEDYIKTKEAYTEADEKHNDKTEIALNTAGLCVSLAILLIIIGVILLTNPECTTVALWLIIPSAIAGIASILNLVSRLICFKNTKKGKTMRNEIDNLLDEILMNTDI